MSYHGLGNRKLNCCGGKIQNGDLEYNALMSWGKSM